MTSQSTLTLYGRSGQRKYLTASERKRFYNVAMTRTLSIKLFLMMLFYSGARISEALNLKFWQIDFEQNIVIFESLKKRRRGIFRAVPLPQDFCDQLRHYLIESNIENRIWRFTRRTASRYVRVAMVEANIKGEQASAKGLRHSFAVSAIEKDIPLNLIRNWMGHSSIETTAIYLNVSGQEERRFAERMWDSQ